MKTQRERRMLAEMGVTWPALLPGPAEAAPVPPPQTQAPVAPPAETASPQPAAAAAQLASPPGSLLPISPDLDWDGLQREVSSCTRCGLCRTRRSTVFGVGHERAPWMIVGEAPGEQEDREGEPFVGAAGQLLDRMLAALSLSRDPAAAQVFITNTVKCRPPQNRNPLPDELLACAPFLQAQIAQVRPRVLLAMGRFAAQQLLGTEEPIGRLRGRVHSHEADPGFPIPVIVTYHPAYLLRNPADKGKAWSDLCLAQAVISRA